MEKQEWFEYFEAVNGRKPTLEEFSKAKASGFFEKKKASEKEENSTSPQEETAFVYNFILTRIETILKQLDDNVEVERKVIDYTSSRK